MDAIADETERAAQQARFNALASGFYAEYSEQVAQAMPEADSACFDLEGILAFATAMAGFDRASLEPVQQGKFVAGVSRDQLRSSARALLSLARSLSSALCCLSAGSFRCALLDTLSTVLCTCSTVLLAFVVLSYALAVLSFAIPRHCPTHTRYCTPTHTRYCPTHSRGTERAHDPTRKRGA
eukprot:2162594-Rhodomonas_salina.1